MPKGKKINNYDDLLYETFVNYFPSTVLNHLVSILLILFKTLYKP